MSQATDLNHYVPRGYLSRWSSDGIHILEHKLVVPVKGYPKWRPAPLRGTCARKNIYDSHLPGVVRDHFERWLKNEVEEPAYRAIARLEKGDELRQEDWEALVRFAVAQDRRTLKSQMEHEALEAHAFREAVSEIAKLIQNFDPSMPPAPSSERSDPEDEIPVFDWAITPQGEGAVFEVSALAGSTSWMQSLKRMVRVFTPDVSQHLWQIIEPCSGQTWPTSDHPLVRFERKPQALIHGTGWLRKATEIFLPLTPRYAMYTKVGEIVPRPRVASRAETYEFVKLLIGHAHRSVFADRGDYKWIEWETRRRVDLEEYKRARP